MEELRPEHESVDLEETPPPPEEEAQESHPVDPAFLFFVLVVITLLGLNGLAVEVRYTVLWSALTITAVFTLLFDRFTIEPLNLRGLLIGIGLAALIGLPVVAVGAEQLHAVSFDLFQKSSDAAIFQMLVFTMPLAEGLFFRAAFHSARGAVFSGLAAGVWSIIMFFPQLDVLRFPLVAFVFGLVFVFLNALYSYVRQRAGFFASLSCQITINLLLLFLTRFMLTTPVR